MKEIVWVFGTSASGKETFMNCITQDTDLQEKFGWKDKLVAVCEDSLKYIGQFENDPIVDSREGILEQVASLLTEADVALIKWQFVDSRALRLTRLHEYLPRVSQRIIKLEAPKSELTERLKQKTWWHDYGQEEAFIDSEIKTVGECINELGTVFAVTDVASGASDGYSVTG